jgi:transcriptional regulator with PAS, ATPase and Fis domain
MTEKPSYEELEQRLEELAAQLVALERSTSYLTIERGKKKEKSYVFKEIVTNDKNMLSIFKYIDTIAPTSQPVMITGETGVGKEF